MSFLLDTISECFGSCFGGSSELKVNGRSLKIVRLLGEVCDHNPPSKELVVAKGATRQVADVLFRSREASLMSTLFKTTQVVDYTLLKRSVAHLAKSPSVKH